MTRTPPTPRTYRQRIPCEHCGYPITDTPRRSEEGTEFCSTYCLEAFDAEEPTTANDVYKRFETGIDPLDSLVPGGFPADSLLLLSGEEGTRRSEFLTELLWRATERDEPVVVVAYANPPTAVLEDFFRLGWNPLPALEGDRLRIVDCFTPRLEDRDSYVAALNDWNRFLDGAVDDAVVEVRDPGDVREVESSLEGAIEDLEMVETGLVVIDSLDELSSLVQEGLIHNFLKELRATVSRARYVPIVTGAAAEESGYPADDEYVFDGIVDLHVHEKPGQPGKLKRLAVRKLTGTSYIPRWVTYEGRPDRGLFTFDPTEANSVYDFGTETPPPRPLPGGR
ncbi:RAD55 family ATPase [Natrialbaceae archaeon A-gly3]